MVLSLVPWWKRKLSAHAQWERFLSDEHANRFACWTSTQTVVEHFKCSCVLLSVLEDATNVTLSWSDSNQILRECSMDILNEYPMNIRWIIRWDLQALGRQLCDTEFRRACERICGRACESLWLQDSQSNLIFSFLCAPPIRPQHFSGILLRISFSIVQHFANCEISQSISQNYWDCYNRQ